MKQTLKLVILVAVLSSAISAVVSVGLVSFMKSKESNHASAPPVPVGAGAFSASSACAKDEERFCANVADGNALDACLQDHFAEVSQTCHEKLNVVRVLYKPCEADIAKYCPNAHFGGNRMIRCLKAYEENLSGECVAVISGRPLSQGHR
jgi:hypothetical protein